MKRIVFTLIAGLLLVAACTPKQTEEKQNDELPLVKVAKAVVKPVNQIIVFFGNIEPFKKNNISSSSAQRIDKIFVEIGDQVKKGQVLVKMESNSYDQAKIQIDNLKVDLARTEALYLCGGVSKQQYDQLKSQADIAEESLRNLELNTKLISPIDGVVTARNFDGRDLTMGQPILTIMQLCPVKILINISEEFFPVIKNGTPVEITLDVYPGQSFQGKISLIYPTIDATTRTFQAQVSIANNNMKIRPGMFARVMVDFGQKNRIMVPDQAIIKQKGTNNKYVYVLGSDNVVTYTQIELGQRVDSEYEVISGLSEGESVVYAGQGRLLDQTKVKVL